jgi:hypothetical protein
MSIRFFSCTSIKILNDPKKEAGFSLKVSIDYKEKTYNITE